MRIGFAHDEGEPAKRGVQRRRWAPMRPDRSADQPGVGRPGARPDDAAPTGRTDHPEPAAPTTPNPEARHTTAKPVDQRPREPPHTTRAIHA